MTRSATVVEITRGKDGQFYFAAKSRNGQTIADSEGYTRPWSARRGAERAFPGAEIRDLTKHVRPA